MGFAPLYTQFPWGQLSPYAQQCAQHPDGSIDLSMGTPVDPTPQLVQRALAEASDAPRYPTTHGSVQLRDAIVTWLSDRRGAIPLHRDAVAATIGSKELVGLLPSLLGLGPGDVVVHPRIAYPTYAVGAQLAGATALATDEISQWAGRSDIRLVWVNSPGNPTGAVASAQYLADVVAAARAIGALVVSDECYAELAWGEWAEQRVPSILDPMVCGNSSQGILMTYSLSKQSSMAGYRAAFIAGDADVVAGIVGLRQQLGLILPAPVQTAMAVALSDPDHVQEQRELYRARRDILWSALTRRGIRIDASEAGLYLWTSWPAGCWEGVQAFAEIGVLVAPGDFYGPDGQHHLRIALTASDRDIARAAERIAQLAPSLS